MSKLIPVIYKNMKYPSHIKANIHELSGNFNKKELIIKTSYSLHTDSASKAQEFNSIITSDLENLKIVQKDGIPQLWYDKKWAIDFFKFVDRLIIDKYKAPEVLEIHPPFNNYPIFKKCRLSSRNFDYDEAFKIFLDIFDVFYKQFNKKYQKTKVIIENRGSSWAGRFLLSSPSDILKFACILKDFNSELKIVLDYPQIFSSLYISSNIKKKKELQEKGVLIDDDILKKVISLNQELENYKEVIGGFHLWGKQKDENGKWRSHAGNLNTLFSNNNELKKKFLTSVFFTFNDDIHRYFVPEVNSEGSDLHSIVTDMEQTGFIFISKIRKTKEYLKLEAFQETFNSYFGSWGIQLPKNNLFCRAYGVIGKAGWLIQFRFGKEDGKEYMDFYAYHRMTNDRHERIYEDGKIKNLPALDYFSYDDYDPNDSEDEKKEKENKERNKIKKLLIEKGFFPFPTTFIDNFVDAYNIDVRNKM